jgi:hypothetical protein
MTMTKETTPWYQDRRQFIGRVSGATAIMVASGLGFRFTPAKKGERLASLSSADATRRFGVSKYRIRYVDTSGGRRRVEADLLGSGSNVVGRFVGAETMGRGTSDIDAIAERELTLGDESIAIRVDKSAKTFRVSHNRAVVGEASVQSGREGLDSRLQAFTAERADLIRFIGEVNQDIATSLSDLAPASFTLTSNVVEAACVCLPKHTHCNNYHEGNGCFREVRSQGCMCANDEVSAMCGSSPFGSCCQGPYCDCGCVVEDLYCYCQSWANSLSCSKVTCS